VKILFITPYIPSLIRVRPYNLLRALHQRGHEITLLCLQPPGDEDTPQDALRDFCEAVHIIPHSRNRTLFNGLRAFLFGKEPIQAAYSHSPAFSAYVQDLLKAQRFDVAHIEHLRGAVLAKGLNLPVVFDSVDSIALLFEKVLQEPPNLKSRLIAHLDLERTRDYEGTLTQRFEQVAVTSEIDRQFLIELGSNAEQITVVPNGVDLDYFQPTGQSPDPDQLIFTGKMSYHANIAAVEDLVNDIMPLVWAKRPNAKLQIVGKDPSPAILEMAQNPKITVTGFVPDIRPYLAQAAIAVSTVRYGVGIQNKVLEAMAMGTPVVCSTQASSALKTVNGTDILVGDSPERIANHILHLLDTPEERQRIAQAGRRYVEEHQTWDNAAQTLEKQYHEAIRRKPLA
jgi:sugar transferase (PEP-CTERM/EpsH1 system associated)